jgi:hypothetical protein
MGSVNFRTGSNPEKESSMTESIEDLEKRRDLLKEIKELSEWCPSEDDVAQIERYVVALKQIEECDLPDEDWMEEVDDHLATLQAIKELDGPTEDDMKAASDHLATLTEIADKT